MKYMVSTLVSMLQHAVITCPDKAAFVEVDAVLSESGAITYLELEAKARGIAAVLQSAGLTDRRVLLLYESALEFAAAFFGCLYARAVAVPHSYPAGLHFEKVLAGADAVAQDAGIETILTGGRFNEIRDRIAGPCRRLAAAAVIDTGSIAASPCGDYQNIDIEPGTITHVQYTSGSTSAPKGAFITHAGLLHILDKSARQWGYTDASVTVNWVPLHHIAGLTTMLLQPIYTQSLGVIIPAGVFAADPLVWLKAMTRYRGTHSVSPNFAYEQCISQARDEDLRQLDLSSWKVAINGGEAVQKKTLTAFCEKFGPCGFDGKSFCPTYGMSEFSGMISSTRCGQGPTFLAVDPKALQAHRVRKVAEDNGNRARVCVGCGQPDSGETVIIVDPATAEEIPSGQVGEIWLAGPSVAGAYLGRPGETSERLNARHPAYASRCFLRTGDLGFKRRGELFITGRIKELIIVRGENYYPVDIEARAQSAHAALSNMTAAAFSCEIDHEEKVVLVQEVPDAAADELQQIIICLRESISVHFGLDAHEIVLVKPGSILRTPGGKIQRAACLLAYQQGRLESICRDAKTGTVQENGNAPCRTDGDTADELIELFSRWLKLSPNEIKARSDLSLAALGLDSYSSIQLVWELGNKFKTDIKLETLLKVSSLAELLELIQKDRAPAPAGLPKPAEKKTGGDGDLYLSLPQQRLWFIHELDPGRPAYTIVQALRIRGSLDEEAFRQALEAVINRHEALRMTFVNRDGIPMACVAATAKLALEVIDAGPAAGAPGEAAARERVRCEALEPFDFVQGPLYRPLLFKLDESEHLFALIFHHIVTDGWSMGIWMRELATVYEAITARRPWRLPEIEAQYTDYAAWQHAWIEQQDFSLDIDYWKKHLAGHLPVLQLPTDYPRPAELANYGAQKEFTIPKPLASLLAARAQTEDCTLFMLLAASLTALLHRYSGQQTMVVGFPNANRDLPELENLIGFFLNMLPLRADMRRDMPFRELLAQIRGRCLDAYAHHELPFERLVDELQPERSLSHHPLFQVMFTLQNFSMASRSAPGITLQPVLLDRGITEYDLGLYMWEDNGELRGVFEYSTELFRPETISRLVGHFVRLLGEVTQDMTLELGKIPLLSAQELTGLAQQWTATDAKHFIRNITAPDMIQEQAERAPLRVAVVCQEQYLTYGKLNQRANQLARTLRKLGVGAESLVGVFLERSVDMVVGILAIHKAGGAYVPLDPAFPAERISFMMEDAGLHLVLTQESLVAEVPASCPARVLVYDRQRPDIEKESAVNLGRSATSGNRAYVIYTSGSTGKPKGVEIEHRALTNFLLSMQREPGLDEDDALLSVTTLSFDIAGLELLLPLITGGRVAIAPRDVAADGIRLAREITTSGATVMQATPATWKMLLDAGWSNGRGLKALCGGEAWTRDLADRLLATGAELWNMYGPTETTIWSSVERILPGGPAPGLGRPIANTRFYILDENRELVPQGVAGELYIGGDGLARGYLKREELTAERFLPDGFDGRPGRRMYRTGDLVRRRWDGSIEFLGRIDNQVKLRGYRIELGEIEHALRRHETVKEAVVIAREDEPGNKALAAYMIPAQDLLPEPAELRTYLRESLPEYMVPSFFVVLAGFPLTPNGKIDRKALPKPDIDTRRRPDVDTAPRDELELRLAAIWKKLLGLKSLSIADNYFDLGGNSLLAVRLFAEIEKATGRQLPLATLFRAPTIEQLADVMRQQHWQPSWSSLVPIRTVGVKPPLFLVHGAGGNVLLYRELVARLPADQPVYGLQAKGLGGNEPFNTRIEDMASAYIAEMRQLQPDGPYFLGGYCMGGLIAYEMARQLEQQGCRTALVALLETCTMPPKPTFITAVHHQYERVLFHLRNLMLISRAEKKMFLRSKLLEAKRRSRATLQAALGSLLQGLKVLDGSPLVPLERINDQAALHYRPQPLEGRITVFAPRIQYTKLGDPVLGWGAVQTGGTSLVRLNVYPAGMLIEPFVAKLAEKLAACLEKAAAEDKAATDKAEGAENVMCCRNRGKEEVAFEPAGCHAGTGGQAQAHLGHPVGNNPLVHTYSS